MKRLFKMIWIPLVAAAAALVLIVVTISIWVKLDFVALIRNENDGEVYADVIYKTIDNKELRLDVHTPRKKLFTKAPVVFMFHGGAWETGSKELEDDNPLDAVLDYGIAIVSVQYRLTDSVTIFPAHIDDCADALRFIFEKADRYGLDKNRICVLGASAGGQLSLLLALAGDDYGQAKGEPLHIKCAVSLCGPTDFLNLEGYNDEERAEVDTLLNSLFGGGPEEKRELYIEASPITHVKKTAPPIFLSHGTKDNIVPFSQAETFYKAGKEVGMQITYVPVLNANHKFRAVGDEPVTPTLDELLGKLVRFLVLKLVL